MNWIASSHGGRSGRRNAMRRRIEARGLALHGRIPDRMGSVAVIIARIGTVVFALMALVSIITGVVFMLDSGMFVPDGVGGLVAQIGGGWQMSIDETLLDSWVHLTDGWGGPANVPAALLMCGAHAAVASLLALSFGETGALLAILRDWSRDVARGARAAHERGETREIAEYGGRPGPFTTEPAERLQRVGWYLITAPVVAFAATTLCALLGCPTSVNGLTSTGLLVMFGGLALLLSRVLDYGSALQRDAEGLL